MPRSAIQLPCVKTARLDEGCDGQEPTMRPGEGPSVLRLCDAPPAIPAGANVSSPTFSPSTMATDQVLEQFIQMIAVHQAMMQETACNMQVLMIQQASFQSELIAQATFQCSTFAHELRADYPTKNANSIESCGAMANAVSLLTAAPVGLPGFEPTHSLEMLLDDGMISSGISESATFHQHCQVSRLLPSLSWKNQSSVTSCSPLDFITKITKFHCRTNAIVPLTALEAILLAGS
ncbi:hypothetical protein PF003_g1192 [Phytophthora fragariae]|nr:hypothetical protein PF003_g1192 [Phytophthora fragariae]